MTKPELSRYCELLSLSLPLDDRALELTVMHRVEQARLTKLGEAQLLSDEQLFALEDLVGDYLVTKPSSVVLTADMLTVHPAAAKLQSLIALSEGFSTNDAAFARQVSAALAAFAIVNDGNARSCVSGGHRQSADMSLRKWTSKEQRIVRLSKITTIGCIALRATTRSSMPMHAPYPRRLNEDWSAPRQLSPSLSLSLSLHLFLLFECMHQFYRVVPESRIRYMCYF
jgi:hypothetical protein